MPIISYKIWADKVLKIPWHGGSIRDTVRKEVSWDARETGVEKASLRFSARASGSTHVYVYMNNDEIMHILWGIIDDMKVKTVTEDVSGILINGNNDFEVRFSKLGVWPFNVSITFTLELIITYSGIEPPKVKDDWQKQILKYLPWIILSGSLATGVAIGLRRRRRP